MRLRIPAYNNFTYVPVAMWHTTQDMGLLGIETEFKSALARCDKGQLFATYIASRYCTKPHSLHRLSRVAVARVGTQNSYRSPRVLHFCFIYE